MKVIKGSTIVFEVQVYTEWTGDAETSVLATPVQLAGATHKLIVKQRATDPDTSALLNADGTLYDANSAKVRFTLPPDTTINLSYETLVFGIKSKLSDGIVAQSIPQSMEVVQNIYKGAL